MTSYNTKNDEYYSSDDEYHDGFKKIKHLTIHDYLDCEETREIITDEWKQRVSEDLEENVTDLFNSFREDFIDTPSDLFKRSNVFHDVELFMLVKHHLVRNYSTDMFKNDPSLANPLLNSLEDIIRKRKLLRKKQIQENFDNQNKTFSWG
jgi:hypothetical protein